MTKMDDLFSFMLWPFVAQAEVKFQEIDGMEKVLLVEKVED